MGIQRSKITRIVLAVMVLILCTWVAYQFWGNTGRVIHTSAQPSNVHYQSHDPYKLRVMVAGTDNIEIQIGENGDFGRYSSFNLTFLPEDVSISQTNWTAGGVEIVFSTGHRIFLPKTSFIGGR